MGLLTVSGDSERPVNPWAGFLWLPATVEKLWDAVEMVRLRLVESPVSAVGIAATGVHAGYFFTGFHAGRETVVR